MNEVNTKTYKMLLIYSLVFFMGFFFLAMLPYSLIDESFWERSTFLTIISVIIGFILVASMILYMYLAISTIKPYKTITNYMKISHIIILVFIYNSILPDESYFSLTIRVIIFSLFGVIIIASNIFCYYKSKSLTEETLINKWNDSSKLKFDTITDEIEGVFLFNMILGAIFMLLIYEDNISTISGLALLVVINGYILYKYSKATNMKRKQNYTIAIAASILSIISITTMVNMQSLFLKNKILYVIVFLLPSIYLFPKMLRNYYVIIWNKSYKN